MGSLASHRHSRSCCRSCGRSALVRLAVQSGTVAHRHGHRNVCRWGTHSRRSVWLRVRRTVPISQCSSHKRRLDQEAVGTAASRDSSSVPFLVRSCRVGRSACALWPLEATLALGVRFTPLFMALSPNWSAHADTQQQVAAARQLLRVGGLQR